LFGLYKESFNSNNLVKRI